MPRVLVVDDEPDLRTILSKVLTRSGIETRAAASAHDAWALIETEEFDAIVLDFNLHGSEIPSEPLLYRIRDNPHGSTIPVILITGVPLPQMLPPEGMYRALFEKPFHLQPFVKKVQEICESTRSPFRA